MLYCGWDGGGTKTEVCLQDETGRTVSSAVYVRLNPNGAQAILVREYPIVRTKTDFWILLHGQCKYVSQCLTHESRWLRLVEEEPEMRAISGTRPFANGGET